ncbi:MAG: hypothetical protein AAF974_08100 [Cyanobacteria bacterium P01_E01_bin.34]
MTATQVQVIDAVEQLGLRVTVGDIAAETGLSLVDARHQIQELAQSADGHLQVSEQGEIAYAFDSNFRSILARKSRRSKLEVYRRWIWGAFLYSLKISFGIILVVSIVLAMVVIAILIAASSQGSGDRRKESQSSRGYGGGYFRGPNIWLWGNPFFGHHRRRSSNRRVASLSSSAGEDAQLNFLEAVYSFLFGDGDPNADLEERQDRAIANRIATSGGVLAVEEVLPYLQAPPKEQQLDDELADFEDLMLPVLVKYDGFPEVSDRGDIVYRFPELQVTADDDNLPAPAHQPTYLEESPWTFSLATSNQRTLIAGLGALNFVLWAGLQASAPELASITGVPTALVTLVFGVLLLYGTGFLIVPLVRWFAIQRRNRPLAERNQRRKFWQLQLQSPSDTLKHKRTFARQFARTEVFEENEAIYRGDRDITEQRDYQLDSPEFRALND